MKINKQEVSMSKITQTLTQHNKNAAMQVDAQFIVDILQPYRIDCRFLKHAVISYPPQTSADYLVRGIGEFSVPGPWYIKDTGHFNAVDSVICFNQLGYVTLASGILSGHLVGNSLPSTGESFKKRMLPDMLIIKISSKFLRPIKSNLFTGSFEIRKLKNQGSSTMIQVVAAFQGSDGGLAEIDALLAVII
jgi:hypothetical protein